MVKRDFVQFCRCLLPALGLTALLALLCLAAALAGAKGAESVFVPVKAAVVDEEDSLISRMLVNMVSGMEEIRAVMTVERMDKAEAQKAMTAGELAAAIILPEDFVEDISRGNTGRGQIILSPAASSHADMVAATARYGQLLLAAGQYGVFSGEALIREHGLDEAFHEAFLARVNSGLLDEAMGAAETYFTVTVTDYAGTAMSVEAYYALNGLVLVLFLSATAFARLCRGDWEPGLLCRLKAAGVRDGMWLLGKYGFPALFRAALLALALALLSRWLPLKVDAGSLLWAGLGVMVISAVGSGLCVALQSGPGVNAALALVGLFLCGGVLPRPMLPPAVLTAGAWSPFGAAAACFAPLFGGEARTSGAVLALGYAAVAVWGSFAALRARRGGGGEG